MWNNLWWIIRFNEKVNVSQYVGSEIPPIPHVGPYWTRAEALKRLWQWGYGFSRGPSILNERR